VVDDALLTVGSANASNRSMGLDTELNLAWEADRPAAGPLGRAIRRARVDLLAEHCGVRHDRAVRRALARRRGPVDHLDRPAADGAHCLRRLTGEAVFEDRPSGSR
jgi:phosphatidylserine/phosphatidylglycerophosphate/cardiolipin synthase-like enzyme